MLIQCHTTFISVPRRLLLGDIDSIGARLLVSWFATLSRSKPVPSLFYLKLLKRWILVSTWTIWIPSISVSSPDHLLFCCFTDPDLTPIHSTRTLIALYAASEPSRSEQILSVIIQELEKKVEEMEVGSPSAGVDMGSKARERQLVTWLAQWIEVSVSLTTAMLEEERRKAEE